MSNFVHPKLTEFIEEMICNLNLEYNFYGEFCNFINFSEENRIPTMGVSVKKNGMHWVYNSKFLDELPQKQVNWGGIHEILHLMYNHPRRTKEHHNHYLANVAQDMIINHIIDTDFNKSFAERIPNTLVLPEEYANMVKADDAKLYFEDLYNWIIEKDEEYKQEKSTHGQSQEQEQEQGQGQGKSQGQGQGQGKGQNNGPDKNGKYPDGFTSKIDKQLRDIFDNYEADNNKQFTFDTHMENEVDDDIAQEIVDQIKEGLKARGFQKGNVEGVLGKLQRKRKDYLKEIKRNISTLKGSAKYKTINRASVIGVEGLKGNRRTGKGLNVILDTSGSMGGDFEKVLSYIFQRNIMVNLIQVDTNVQQFIRLDSLNDFKNLKIKGFGGTELQPGIEYIKNTKALHGFNLCVLTDGYCDSLNFNNIPGCKKVLLISSGVSVPIQSSNTTPYKEIVIDRSVN